MMDSNTGASVEGSSPIEVTPESSARHGTGIVWKSPRTGKITYIPDVNISKRPQVGMRFRTLDEAYGFYMY
ncbi:hypothetical protein Hanom_Chr15g01375091 [Helianthus anomalus]